MTKQDLREEFMKLKLVEKHFYISIWHSIYKQEYYEWLENKMIVERRTNANAANKISSFSYQFYLFGKPMRIKINITHC